MGRFLIILLSFEIYLVFCKEQEFIKDGEKSMIQGSDEEGTNPNRIALGNRDIYNDAIDMVDPSKYVENITSVLPYFNHLEASKNEIIKISQCTNVTLDFFYNAYELYIKSTNYIILIVFRGGQFLVKTLRCFLNNPDHSNVCISNMSSSLQQFFNYATPLISEVVELSKLIISLYEKVDHECF